ncbi:acyl-CoA dehydrogenase family protein [Chryseolinea lacunae]|uniref:Acyl-CoA dehydrogenase family protein n=1 Tax=Chryseolinea lacunae TaxID=2801331 RepID=A0ABS1KU99_9BACT|nr:acyl-CoA dehydrogenase family protein [Chryseolinea lacunae]MBL0743058.1 acyl-CoA dehydrogenase family protein [Chryseolinea lacunae]
MNLDQAQRDRYREFSDFVNDNVTPYAGDWDLHQQMPRDVIRAIGREGYFGAIVPEALGGKAWDFVTFGLLNEAFGRGSSSLTVLFTVQNMVATCLLKWASAKQVAKWIPPMAKGDIVASFALTEPNVGSDIQSIGTQFESHGDMLVLNGTKRWITFAGIADIYLVFGKLNGRPIACVVEKDMPGVEVTPIRDMLGFKACHLAQLDFHDVQIPAANVIGKAGFALSHIAPLGLHYGRLSTAFSSVGLIRAAMETSIKRASTRVVSHATLNNISSIRAVITEMGISYDTSLMMCLNAATAEDNRSLQAIEKTILAKYVASRNAVSAASQAVVISGAHGCHEESSPTARFYRDAKIMEIIEGTTQVLQNVLGNYYVNRAEPLVLN